MLLSLGMLAIGADRVEVRRRALLEPDLLRLAG
jgi:hypothetical protein